MKKNEKIYIAGHNGMVGSAIYRLLQKSGYTNLVVRSLEELDLLRQASVEDFFAEDRPDYVIDAAAKVGGIQANNTLRAEFIYQNMMIQSNLIHAAHQWGVKKFLFLGSSCIYPRLAPQPIREDSLLTGTLELTNEPYAIAKISGIKMCESYFRQYGDNFISVMPTNLYGMNDNYDLKTSHVLPALLRKFHEAKSDGQNFVEVWGTGSPLREFLHVDDMAEACVFVMNNVDADDIYNKHNVSHLNIGSGVEISIAGLAELVAEIVGYEGDIRFDTSKPDGTPRKLLDVSLLGGLGWNHQITLREGIQKVYKHYEGS